MPRPGRVRAGLAVLVATWSLASVGPATAQTAAQDGDEGKRDATVDGATVTVMARNLYLGADVGVALDLLPDLPAAAQFMWDQVAATDFGARAPLLAAEAARHRPAVIGLQEATTWRCRPGNVGRAVTVFDFTAGFLEATREAGVAYVVAERDGRRAFNEGYAIPALPFLSRVHDPGTFQPLFGRDTATCGFAIADALLVREDLAGGIQAVGTSEYRDRYVVAPTVLAIDRGYAWADLRIDGATIRFVTTHLESLWDPDAVPTGAMQASQLVEDLAGTTLPLVVIGDLNSDPRDPRPPGTPNPGGQPEAGDGCRPQTDGADVDSAETACNAYWMLRRAGLADAGPDAADPANLTWGTSALLAGPDPARVDDALAYGNPAGFTDRLDYVLASEGIVVQGASLTGAAWPDGEDVWACGHPAQVENTERMTARLAEAGQADGIDGQGVCLPTDHAGLVVTVQVPPNAVDASSPPLPGHPRFPIGFWGWVGIGILALVVWRVTRRVRTRRRSPGTAPPPPPSRRPSPAG